MGSDSRVNDADKSREEPEHDEQDWEYDDEEEFEEDVGSSVLWTSVKLMAAATLCWSALQIHSEKSVGIPLAHAAATADTVHSDEPQRRRLTEVAGGTPPSYMEPVMKDLAAREKLFADTPPEEVKYWFEYAGPLQKYFYRYSRSRKKADYFEGRDDSGVVSARFIADAGGTEEYQQFYGLNAATQATNGEDIPYAERSAHMRLLENCLAMGSPNRPDTSQGTVWNRWFGGGVGASSKTTADRCRILFSINTVGAGRGTTMLWETQPPALHAEMPPAWTSEQETAATHLERNLEEINAMCATGLIAARVQMLVCEPIPAIWTEWMDSKLTHCGGKPWALDQKAGGGSRSSFDQDIKVEERPSPVQVVVSASSSTADTCHDLKSGFMEKRLQDLILAPPFLGNKKNTADKDPTVKMTHPDLISSDDHDLYVALKWSSMVTLRSVHAFLQASADIAAAASSKVQPAAQEEEKGPDSPFLIPSFVRVAYVSEENSKVAKWRMHGDFFHPAAWEICKDSFDTTWIPHSLSGSGGVTNICETAPATAVARKLAGSHKPEECGQWWVYFHEFQMPVSPEVYANEVTPPPVQGGSNFIWMVTERQRQEVVKGMVCRHEQAQTKKHKAGDDEENDDADDKCPELPVGVMPLGDLESFLINFTPNTALGKSHVKGRRPGYSREEEREMDRRRVKDRKQLHGQEDIEKALFDYTIYPAALFHKDATIKAARARDDALTADEAKSGHDGNTIGPHTCKSSYYDVTITKPRPPLLGWCQHIARKGLCTLYADYFRLGSDDRCMEACGMKKNWSEITPEN